VHTYTIPQLGYAADYLRTPLGWMLFVLIPISMLCLLTLRDIWLGDEKPAAGSKTSHYAGSSSSHPPSVPRRSLASRLPALLGAARIALLAGLVFLAVGLADGDGNAPAGSDAATHASTAEPARPLATPGSFFRPADWNGAGSQFNLAFPTFGGGGLSLDIGR